VRTAFSRFCRFMWRRWRDLSASAPVQFSGLVVLSFFFTILLALSRNFPFFFRSRSQWSLPTAMACVLL